MARSTCGSARRNRLAEANARAVWHSIASCRRKPPARKRADVVRAGTTRPAGNLVLSETIATASCARTTDPQIHKLEGSAQVADIALAVLDKIAQIFLTCTAV